MKMYVNQLSEVLSTKKLPSFQSIDEFNIWRQTQQKKFHKMLGIDHYLNKPQADVKYNITRTLQLDTYRIDQLYYEVLPNTYVSGHLYVPHQLPKNQSTPAILYVCGHSYLQKIQYQDHPRRFAQLGFVVLIIDTVQLGELPGTHHGTYAQGRFDWVSRGYTPAAAEVWNGMKGIDLLSSLPEVDPHSIGVTGHSGGGSISWWIGCADNRVKAIASSSGTGQFNSHIQNHTLDGHCDCNFFNNSYGWTFAEGCAIMAPRPVLIIAPDRDYVFEIDSVRSVYDQLKELYVQLGAEESIQLFDFPAPHQYTRESRQNAFAWFLKHLMNKDIEYSKIDDIDEVKIEQENLFVYMQEMPNPNVLSTIQDWFVPTYKQQYPHSQEHLAEKKKDVTEILMKESFSFFEALEQTKEAQLPLKIKQRMWAGNKIARFSFESEPGVELRGELRGEWDFDEERPPERINDHIQTYPQAFVIRKPGDISGNESFSLLNHLSPEWVKARIDVRGVGDTAWGDELNWHIRRSALLLGRTVAGMRVWDTLQAIKKIRALSKMSSQPPVIAASGEMCTVALFAALLYGDPIDTIILENPPDSLATADEVGANGKASFKEIINALRITDLADVASLLWPAKIVFVGKKPESYVWTSHVYAHLGSDDHIMHRNYQLKD